MTNLNRNTLLIDALMNLSVSDFNAIYDEAMANRDNARDYRDELSNVMNRDVEALEDAEQALEGATAQFEVVYSVYLGNRHPDSV